MRGQAPKAEGKGRSSAGRAAGRPPVRTMNGHAAPPPEIPDKLYFKIGEVAKLCAVQAYVLRFWETEFPQLKPGKSGTGQRLYRRKDVELALRIRHLLYDEGYTIPGARQAFLEEARARECGGERQSQLPLEGKMASGVSVVKVQRLQHELREILGLVSRPVGKPRLVSRERVTPPKLFQD